MIEFYLSFAIMFMLLGMATLIVAYAGESMFGPGDPDDALLKKYGARALFLGWAWPVLLIYFSPRIMRFMFKTLPVIWKDAQWK